MRRHLVAIAYLVVLLTLLDQLYRVLHPEVNFARATLVGLTAYASLLLLRLCGLQLVSPMRGALSIGISAFGSVALIETGWLVSRSSVSGVVHALILAFAYLALGLSETRGGAERDQLE